MKANPYGLGRRLVTFIVQIIGFPFTKLWLDTFDKMLPKYTRYTDPRALPSKAGAFAFYMCGLSSACMITTPILWLAGQWLAFGTLFLAVAFCAISGQVLRRRIP